MPANYFEQIWVCDPIKAQPLSRALIAEIEMTTLPYAEKLIVLGEIFAAVTANAAKKAEIAAKGKLSAKEMEANALVYFHNQCRAQLAGNPR